MTALERAASSSTLSSNNKSPKNNKNATNMGRKNRNKGNVSNNSPNKSKLSLRGQKRNLSSDISPAPELRTSHRIRTSSTGEHDDKNKVSC